MTQEPADAGVSCPLPLDSSTHILLAHGGGGTLMHRLIQQVFLPVFDNPALAQRHDAAVLDVGTRRVAFTTDSYVVKPLFFPGGDIGSLAVYGTVNDLAMAGARPLCLSAGFILEEGLPMETLTAVVESMRRAAGQARVFIATGDTKVVDRGKGDGVFVNVTGLGVVEHDLLIAPCEVRPGDVVLLNGDLGRHGIAIMASREGLRFEHHIESDCAPLAGLVLEILSAGIPIHCMRDLTRGGLASAANEIAEAARLSIRLDESAIPVREDVRGACELLGFDPLYVANEGRFIAFVPPSHADHALSVMQAHPLGAEACVIGRVEPSPSAVVVLKSVIGASRFLDMLSGEQLPRIC